MPYANYIKSFKGFTARTIARVKDRSKKKGIPFDLDTKWYREQLSSGVCSVTGLPFDFSYDEHEDNGRILPFSPSIDRIIPSKGYTKDNCRAVVWIYNVCKQDYTDNDVMRMAEALTSPKEI